MLKSYLESDAAFDAADVIDEMCVVQGLATDCVVLGASLSGKVRLDCKRHFHESSTLLECLLQSRCIRNLSKQGEVIIRSIRIAAPLGMKAPGPGPPRKSPEGRPPPQRWKALALFPSIALPLGGASFTSGQ